MGAYAVPSNQPFVTKKPLKTKRQRTAYQIEMENLLELLKGAELQIDKETMNIRYVRDGKTVAVFKDEDDESE